ncbi:hypothetical protein [Maritalea sp.]|uniref:hypothetical protein n=1 Tax=Maritalea sp. TaxID=2003361 RepID=UPI003EF0DE86
MPASIDNTREATRFLLKCLKLYDILLFNLYDKNAKTESGYYYFLDPDVIELLFLPTAESWMQEFGVFGDDTESGKLIADVVHEQLERRSLSDRVTSKATGAASILAGEYIFGGNLPQQNSHPLLVSVDHIGELTRLVERLRRQTTNLRKPHPDPGTLTIDEHLMRLEAQLASDSDYSSNLAVRKISRIISAQVEQKFDMAGVARVQRLFKRRNPSALLRADLFDKKFSAQSPPPKELYHYFKHHIREIKKRRPHPPSNSAIDADAMTLAQIIHFNSATSGQKMPRAVLITRDTGVTEAYRSWRKSQASSEQNFPCIRSPMQFHPAINLSQMPGNNSGAHVFNTLQKSIEKILASYFSVRGNSPYYYASPKAFRKILEGLFRRDGAATDISSLVNEVSHHGNKIANLWDELTAQSVSLKADSLVELRDQTEEFFVSFLDKEGINAVVRSVDGLSRDFFHQANAVALPSLLIRHIAWAIQSSNISGWVRRAPHTFLANNAEYQLIQKLIARLLSNSPHDFVNDITTLFESDLTMDQDETNLALGCLALEFGAWPSALVYLRDFDEVLKPTAKCDHKFAFSLALRLSSTRTNIDENIDTSLRILESEGSKPHSELRWQSEAIATIISKVILLKSTDDNGLIPACLETLVPFLSGASICLSKAARPHSVADRAAQIQILGSLKFLEVWFELGLIPKTEIKPNLQHLLSEFHNSVSDTESVERMGYSIQIYEILGSDEGVTAAKANEALELISRVVSKDSELGIAFELPYIDEVEFKVLGFALSTYISKATS